jgi:hypothetical protein
MRMLAPYIFGIALAIFVGFTVANYIGSITAVSIGYLKSGTFHARQ